MQLTFVNHYSDGPLKRRRLAKACEDCRMRKKRCMHFYRAPTGSASTNSTPMLEDSSELSLDDGNDQNAQEHLQDGKQPRRPADHASSGQSPHFVADLQPVSTLLEGRPHSATMRRKHFSDELGVWVDRHEWETLVKQQNDKSRAGYSTVTAKPEQASLDALINVYFEKVHPILPLIDEQQFNRNYVKGIAPEPLVYAMCLVAAKDSSARTHLRSSDDTAQVPVRHFCSMLFTHITEALKISTRLDKYSLIRVLALSSLHNEGSDGAEEASMRLCQAMHHAQSLGIHLGELATMPTASEMSAKRLFWCLYTLDRTNTAINGRPLIMHDIDVGATPFEPGQSGFPAFEIWLRITELLNGIFRFYRPTFQGSTTGWEDVYPGLEEIIDGAGGWHLPPSILATIHIFYLAVAMLSHRTRGMTEVPRASASQVRQRLCAIEVIRLLETPASANVLHPLPIVPYAASLSLSVAYQHLRQSQLVHQQNDARADFRICCNILQRLRQTWCSADIMAALAKKVLEEIDRTPDLSLFRAYRARRDHDDGGASTNSISKGKDLIPAPTICYHGPAPTTASVEHQPSTEFGEGGDSAVTVDVNGHVHNGLDIFENMDDVFGTFLDPNYPLSFEDMSFLDGLASQENAVLDETGAMA